MGWIRSGSNPPFENFSGSCLDRKNPQINCLGDHLKAKSQLAGQLTGPLEKARFETGFVICAA